MPGEKPLIEIFLPYLGFHKSFYSIPMCKSRFTAFVCLMFLSVGFSKAGDDKDKFVTGGRLNLAAGTGFGIYNLSNNQFGDKDAGALNGNLHLSLDYGLLPSLTAGISLFRNGFATDKDSNEAATITGLGIYLHYNFARRPKTTWYLNGGFGGSTFTYANYNNNGEIRGSGGYSFLGLGFRRYFGDHFGLFSELNVTGYNYDQFIIQSDDRNLKNQVFKTTNGNDFGLALAGAEFKFGLVYAFGQNEK